MTLIRASSPSSVDHKRDDSSNGELHFEIFGGDFAKCNDVMCSDEWLKNSTDGKIAVTSAPG
jgi:hypothetical protein